MNYVKQSVINFFTSEVKIFGDTNTYEAFEEEPTATNNGFNSVQLSGRIIYKDKFGDVQKSQSIFIKGIPEIKNSKFVSFAFINEMNFFTKIVPAFDTLDGLFSSLFPQYLHGEINFKPEGDQPTIIFENLQSQGYRMSNKKSFQDYHHLMLMMRKLGQFHAYSYAGKAKIPDLYHPLANSSLETYPIANRELHGGLKAAAGRGIKQLLYDERYAARAKILESTIENSVEIFLKAIANDDDSASVICHGDFLSSNVMFRYENEIPVDLKFVDLATYRLASPVLDLALALYLHTDQNTRNEFWDALIDEYYTSLCNTHPHISVPSRDEILLQFKGKAYYAYLVSSYFLPCLIDIDNNISYVDPLPEEYRNRGLHELPDEFFVKRHMVCGGETGTEALADILRDMIDRGFIC